MSKVVYICLFLFCALLASASPVNYGWSQFDADSDVLTNGTLVFAVNLGSEMDVTINGVLFEADAVDLFNEGISVSNGSFYAGGAIGNLSSAATSNLLHTVESNQSTSGDRKYQLTDLTVGMRYTFQVIYSFTNSPGNSMYYNYAVLVDGVKRSDWFQTPARILPGVVTGSFVARQPTQDLYVAYGGGNYAVAAAFQLRKEPCYKMRENWEHTMAAGSFGVAYITASGDVMHSDTINAPKLLIVNKSVKRILAGDVAGTSADELVYVVGTENNRLYYYDFETGQTVNTGGNKIIDLTALRWDKSDSKMTLVINQPTLYTYRNSSWNTMSSATATHLMRGDFVFGDGTDELVTRTSSDRIYIFDSETSVSRQIGGVEQFIAVPADLSYYRNSSGVSYGSNGDELFLQHSTGLYRTIVDPAQSQHYAALGWSPSETNLLGGTDYITGVLTNSAACGDVDGYGDRGYTCLGGSIERRSEAWESDWAENNNGFKYVILADIDQNGFDEVYAVKVEDETLWYADLSKDAVFKPVGGYPAGTVIIVY
jgi:hypothetical protein